MYLLRKRIMIFYHRLTMSGGRQVLLHQNNARLYHIRVCVRERMRKSKRRRMHNPYTQLKSPSSLLHEMTSTPQGRNQVPIHSFRLNPPSISVHHMNSRAKQQKNKSGTGSLSCLWTDPAEGMGRKYSSIEQTR